MKLAAFKEVVEGWERYLDSISDDADKKQWLQHMRQTQDRFIEIPLDPKASSENLRESMQILELYVQRLRETTEIMKTYQETGMEFETASEMALWKELVRHLNRLIKND